MDMNAWSVLSHISRLRSARMMESSSTASDINIAAYSHGSTGWHRSYSLVFQPYFCHGIHNLLLYATNHAVWIQPPLYL